MSVYDFITENIFLFGGFWVFTCVLGVLTAVIFRRSAYLTWMKIIGILGGSAAIHLLALTLVSRVLDRRYTVPDPVVETTSSVVDLVLVPMQVIGMAAMHTLNTIIFNVYFSTALWLLVLGIAIYKLRPVKGVKE